MCTVHKDITRISVVVYSVVALFLGALVESSSAPELVVEMVVYLAMALPLVATHCRVLLLFHLDPALKRTHWPLVDRVRERVGHLCSHVRSGAIIGQLGVGTEAGSGWRWRLMRGNGEGGAGVGGGRSDEDGRPLPGAQSRNNLLEQTAGEV